jgi:polysaccharide biosynthesis transport protein
VHSVATPDSTNAGAAGPQGQTFKDYLRLLWGRKWVVLLVAVVVTGGVEYLALRQTPVYQANARVVVPPPPPVIVNGVVQPQARTEEFLATQAEVLASPEVATLVVADLHLSASPESISHRVRVDPIPNTDILRIFISASTPQQAADLANSVVNQYLLYRHRTDKRSLQVQQGLLDSRIADDQRQLDALKHQDQTNPQVIAKQNSLLADLNVQRNKLADLQQALTTVENGGSVLEAAHVPSAPVSPDKVRSAIIGVVLGLLLGAAAAFTLEYFRDNLSSPAEVERIAGAGVLALVPGSRRTERNPLLISEDDERRPLTEAFRTLRTNLLFLARRDDLKTLVITSPAPGDGKTTVSANLAISLTQAGYRVVLIDGDLRKPRVHEAFGIDNSRGLIDVVRDGVSVHDVVMDPGIPKLRIIPSGGGTDQPTELLGGPRMAEAVEACKKASDFVIIDSPPVVAVADPSVLAMNSDGIVIVMTQETGRRTLIQARTQLQRVGARILGVVVNRVESTRRGYYYYDHYYPYYRQSRTNGDDRGGKKKLTPQGPPARRSGF